jgi:hypothetical protein
MYDLVQRITDLPALKELPHPRTVRVLERFWPEGGCPACDRELSDVRNIHLETTPVVTGWMSAHTCVGNQYGCNCSAWVFEHADETEPCVVTYNCQHICEMSLKEAVEELCAARAPKLGVVRLAVTFRVPLPSL